MTPAFSEALALLSPRQKGRGFVAKCPAHDDKSPSLNVDEADGKVLLKCQAGCDTRDVVSALGLSMTDLFDADTNNATEPLDKYQYRDAAGRIVYEAWNWGRNHVPRFTMHMPDGTTGIGDTPRVPYRLPEVIAAGRVVIVEGEKDADRLTALGIPATTSPGGAGNWRDSYAEHFVGKQVVILPDNDEPGQKHAIQVESSLRGVARRARIVLLPDPPPKKGADVSDWLDAGHTPDELRSLLDDTAHLRYERMGDIEVQEDAPLAIDPYVLDEGPCILFGDGGSGKSTLALVLAASFATGHEVIPGSPPTISAPVMWLDYEAQRRTSAKRLKLMGLAHAPILYVPGLRPIADDVDRLASIAEAEGVGLIVVDSVVLAVGGSVSPKDAEAPTQYANAVAAIATRSIGLAHVVKSTEDDGKKPFGSGYWHNIARLTWHMKRDDDEPGHVVRLTCRKRNDGEAFAPRTISFDWQNGLRVSPGPVVSTVAGLIEQVLAVEGVLSAAAIGAHLGGKSAEHVTSELKRHPDKFIRTKDTDNLWKWGLVQ